MSTDELVDRATEWARLLPDAWPETKVLVSELTDAVVQLRDEVESKARDGRLRLSAMTAERDAAVTENERLFAVEFVHTGCETIRRKDVQAALDQRDAARAALERVQGAAAAIADDCAHHEAEEGDPAQVRTRTGWSDVSDYAQDITRALEGTS